MLDNYCAELDLGKPPVLHNAIIKEMAAQPTKIPDELSKIIQAAVA